MCSKDLGDVIDDLEGVVVLPQCVRRDTKTEVVEHKVRNTLVRRVGSGDTARGAPWSDKTLRGESDTQALACGGLAEQVYIAKIGETNIVDGRRVKRGRQPQIDHLCLTLIGCGKSRDVYLAIRIQGVESVNEVIAKHSADSCWNVYPAAALIVAQGPVVGSGGEVRGIVDD